MADKLLIVNADDLGRTPGINAGIFEAHDRGLVTSATLMVGYPAAVAAAREAAARPGLGVGLHVQLTGGVPTLPPLFRRALRILQVHRANPDIDKAIDGLDARVMGVGWMTISAGWCFFGLSSPMVSGRELTARTGNRQALRPRCWWRDGAGPILPSCDFAGSRGDR